MTEELSVNGLLRIATMAGVAKHEVCEPHKQGFRLVGNRSIECQAACERRSKVLFKPRSKELLRQGAGASLRAIQVFLGVCIYIIFPCARLTRQQFLSLFGFLIAWKMTLVGCEALVAGFV